MLFNSNQFIFLFLPITLIVYFVLNKRKLTLASKAWLMLASLFFYGWWKPIYIPLIIGSILFNYAIGTLLAKKSGLWSDSKKKTALIIGIVVNLGLLGYFKYTDFFITNINYLAKSNIGLAHIILPLGISFFTFTQIAYLVDTYKGKVNEYSFWNYSLFVTFFPHLLAGPIIHHKEMMPQFDRLRNKVLNYKNLSQGFYLLSIGLSKKVILADTFAVWANKGFDQTAVLPFFHAWITSLSYTLQLYFDFSGYTDMALGAAMMFNIKLPANFNSPYKSLNIQDFWRRWHITLSRFLRDYIYIPMGGNRISESRTLLNLMITFLIGGFWHGAGWTFVLWGFLHGIASVIHRLWEKLNITMPKFLAWFITFNFVNIAWVFFRAKTIEGAANVLKGMFGMNGFVLPARLAIKLGFLKAYGFEFGQGFAGKGISIPVIFVSLLFVLIFKNSNEIIDKFKPNWKNVILVSIMIIMFFIRLNKTSEFIYFNF
jgi:alginate O-acetyltransferase complex protein AlgI